MTKVRKTKAELEGHLKEQIDFLQRSALAYDDGYEHEGQRLATTIRVLFHDSKKTSNSLLGQLGIKDNLMLFDSASPIRTNNLFPHHGLTKTRVKVGTGGSFIPRLESMKNLRRKGRNVFSKWWERTVVIDNHKNQFSRRVIVLALSNKDGGAHVDPSLDAAYSYLTRELSMGWSYSDGKTTEVIRPIELASVRQISHEVLMTLKKIFPEYVGDYPRNQPEVPSRT